MHNAIILGSGRSGTSLVAGLLSESGYYMGDKLYPPHPKSNAKGFFECKEINDINEDILDTVSPKRLRILGKEFLKNRPIRNQRWLARLAPELAFASNPEMSLRIQKLVDRKPFCLKDPRFSYTLPVWKPYLKDARFICVFRHPAQTAASILRECATRPYLKGLQIDFSLAVETWERVYQSIMRQSQSGDWLFIHYHQALHTEGREKLKQFLDAPVKADFPDSNLETPVDFPSISQQVQKLYRTLCEKAGHQP